MGRACLIRGWSWPIAVSTLLFLQVVEEENAARAGREAELAADLFARLHPGRRLELDVMHPEIDPGKALHMHLSLAMLRIPYQCPTLHLPCCMPSGCTAKSAQAVAACRHFPACR